jgi:hypothetical protein
VPQLLMQDLNRHSSPTQFGPGPAAPAGAGVGSAGGGHRDDYPRAGPGRRSPAAAAAAAPGHGSESRASESGPAAPPGTAVTVTAAAHGRTWNLFQVASDSGPGRRGGSRIIQLGHPAAVSAKTRKRCDSEMSVIHWQLHGIRVVRVMMVATVESVELQLDFT